MTDQIIQNTQKEAPEKPLLVISDVREKDVTKIAEQIGSVYKVDDTIEWMGFVIALAHASSFWHIERYILGFGLDTIKLYPDRMVFKGYDLFNHYTFVLHGLNERKAWEDTPHTPDRIATVPATNIILYLKRTLDRFFANRGAVRVHQELDDETQCPSTGDLSLSLCAGYMVYNRLVICWEPRNDKLEGISKRLEALRDPEDPEFYYKLFGRYIDDEMFRHLEAFEEGIGECWEHRGVVGFKSSQSLEELLPKFKHLCNVGVFGEALTVRLEYPIRTVLTFDQGTLIDAQEVPYCDVYDRRNRD